ncbi:MAG: hypothetical protein Q4G02_03295 [bacterium]|nr:hypothetical protein [bacterium]
MILGLTLDFAEFLLQQLHDRYKLSLGEPVFLLDQADLHKLNSALKSPFQLLANLENCHLEQMVVAIGARLFCGLIQNHSLLNGNKRSAVLFLYAFCLLNGFTIKDFNEDALYQLAMQVNKLVEEKTFSQALIETEKYLRVNLVAQQPIASSKSFEFYQKEFTNYLFSRD